MQLFLNFPVLGSVIFSLFWSGITPSNGQQISVTPEYEIDWILQRQVASGAFLVAQQGTWVLPYDTNIALINVLRLNTSDRVTTAVKKWIDWYISKLEYPESGVAIISDWDVYPNGSEVSRNKADSTDSYAATFLSLVRQYYYASGDRSYVQSLSLKLQQIAEGALYTFNPDLNLTCALKSYCEYYLMDNIEVWKGFQDVSELFADLLEPIPAYYWGVRSVQIRSGIEQNIYDPSVGYYREAWYSDGRNPTDWSTLSPGALSNIYTQTYKLDEALESGRRDRIFQLFSGPPMQRWINRNFTEGVNNTDFPLAYVSEGVALNGDYQSVEEWKNNVYKLWFPKEDWTWNMDDASYFLLRL